MSKVKLVKIVIVIGILVFLKISLDSVTKISEPISNVVVFVGLLIFAIYLGYTSVLKENNRNKRGGLK